MSKEQEYQKANDFINEAIGKYTFCFERAIDINTLDTIKYTMNNASSFIEEEWLTWWYENKNNFAVICAGLDSGYVPKSVTKKIVNNLNMVKLGIHNRGIWTEATYKDKEIISLLLKNDMYKESFDKIYNLLKSDIFSVAGLSDKNNEKTASFINSDVMNMLAQISIVSFAKNDIFSIYKEYPDLVSCVRDENFIKEILKDDQMKSGCPLTENKKEIIRACIVSNTFLSDDLRNKVFDMGCDWFYIKNFTDKIVEDNYFSVADTYTETTELKNCSSTDRQQAYIVLARMLESHKMSESLEIDLANRIIKDNENRYKFIAETLFLNAKTNKIFEMAEKFKSFSKISIYNHPNMPDNILTDRVNELCKKMVDFSNKNKEYPKKWDTYLRNYAQRITFTDQQYEFLFNTTKDKDLIIGILLSDKTPEHIINYFFENFCKKEKEYKFDATTYVAAEMAKYLKENETPETVKDFVKTFLWQRFINSYIEFSKIPIKPALSETKFIEKMLRFMDKKAKELSSDGELHNQNKVFHFKDCENRIKNMYKKETEKEKYYTTKSTSGISNETIEEIRQELINIFISQKNVPPHKQYLLLEENMKDINIIFSEFTKRKNQERAEFKKEILEEKS